MTFAVGEADAMPATGDVFLSNGGAGIVRSGAHPKNQLRVIRA